MRLAEHGTAATRRLLADEYEAALARLDEARRRRQRLESLLRRTESRLNLELGWRPHQDPTLLPALKGRWGRQRSAMLNSCDAIGLARYQCERLLAQVLAELRR